MENKSTVYKFGGAISRRKTIVIPYLDSTLDMEKCQQWRSGRGSRPQLNFLAIMIISDYYICIGTTPMQNYQQALQYNRSLNFSRFLLSLVTHNSSAVLDRSSLVLITLHVRVIRDAGQIRTQFRIASPEIPRINQR